MDLDAHIDRFESRLAELEAALGDPSVFSDQKKSQELSRDYTRVKGLVELGRDYRSAGEELKENKEILELESSDSELAEMAQEEVKRLTTLRETTTLALRSGILPPDPTDSRDTIVEIRAGAGGSESALFAAELYRMFNRYAERQGWKIEVMDSSPSDLNRLYSQRQRCLQALKIRERRPPSSTSSRHGSPREGPYLYNNRRCVA